MDNIPVIRWSVVMERTDIGGFVSYHDYAMLYERIESMREDMQGRICIGKESSDEIDTLHARVAELEARIAELQPMAECATIMAFCGYFSRMRGPDEWYCVSKDGFTKRRVGTRQLAELYTRECWTVTPLYAGSAPVPAVSQADYAVPDAREVTSQEWDGMDETARGFVCGWNRCRDAMLAAKAKGGGKENLTTAGQEAVLVEIFHGTRDALNKLSVFPSKDKP